MRACEADRRNPHRVVRSGRLFARKASPVGDRRFADAIQSLGVIDAEARSGAVFLARCLVRQDENRRTTSGARLRNSINASHVGKITPFGGAGTTGLVADRLGRNALLIELNPAYAALGTDRITNDAPLFADVQSA